MEMTNEASAVRAAGLSLRQLRLFQPIGDLRSVRRASEECSLRAITDWGRMIARRRVLERQRNSLGI